MRVYDGSSERGSRNWPGDVAITLNRQWRRNSLAFMADADREPQEKQDAAIHEFLTTLGGLVDQWIDSGKREGDASIEQPWKRDIHWQSADHPQPITTTLIAYWERNPPQVTIDGDGRSSIFVPRNFPRPTDALFRAREHAIFQFVKLLESPTRERLSRCDECRTYFFRARAPKKDTPIFRGTFCPNCKGKGSARRVNATRGNRTKQMVELAVEFWRKWKSTTRHGERSRWVARMMNRRRRTGGVPITGKWVTQHRHEIEAKIERRK
jgi:hypothetical protein